MIPLTYFTMEAVFLQSTSCFSEAFFFYSYYDQGAHLWADGKSKACGQ